ncbi:uncharacterized protein [Triticum aestivum]|uniref:uncharacterized protein isoform X1 n=1 Tax=Triticum aestivum TaxID=4565 RepID=UPI001D0128D6|nr:uncharacterized protein LOC123092092 isoform X1 [Triticum aestivum]
MGGAYWLTLLNSGRVSLDWAAKMANSGASGATGISSDTLYKELWHACARPLITVPHQGERIYYFHMVIWNRPIQKEPKSTELYSEEMLTIFKQRCRGRGIGSEPVGVEEAREEDGHVVCVCREEAVAAVHGTAEVVIEGREDGNLRVHGVGVQRRPHCRLHESFMSSSISPVWWRPCLSC